jgi:hypothetical protein
MPAVALPGSTLLARFGTGRPIAPDWTASDAALTMNARGDALITYDSCCPMRIAARRRAPFGAFGPDEDIVPPLTFTGSRGGRVVRDARLDALGNAAVTWTDFEPEPDPLLLSRDSPLLDVVPDIAVPPVAALVDLLPAPVVPTTPSEADPGIALPPTLALPPFALPTGTHLPAGVSSTTSAGVTQLAVEVDPPSESGSATIRVTVACSTACEVALAGTLTGPDGRALKLPSLSTALDRAAITRLTLPLTAAARHALKPAAKAKTRAPSKRASRAARTKKQSTAKRRFTLRLSATARGRGGKVVKTRAVARFTRR